MEAFFSKALQLIPSVATSPLALLAYALTIGAYVFVALRVQRHKNLLQHLSMLPEADRIKALQSELGQAKLRVGISPEQWVRNRIHHYYFLSFIATCATVIILVIILLYRSAGSVDIDVSGHKGASIRMAPLALLEKLLPSANAAQLDFSDKQDSPDRDSGTSASVRYSYKKVDGRLVIRPSSTLLDAIYAESEVEGFSFWHQPFEWDFPTLSVKVVNNTSKTLLLSEVFVDVEESKVDLRPVLIIRSPSYFGKFSFRNEGWGPVRNPSLAVTMNTTSCEEAPSSSKASPPVEKFDDFREINLNAFVGDSLRSQVVRCTNEVESVCYLNLCTSGGFGNRRCTDDYSGSPICKSVDKPLSPEEMKRTFDFAKPSNDAQPSYMRACRTAPICVRGTLTYQDADSKDRTYRFKNYVFLDRPGAGAPMPPSYSYDIFLAAGKSGYSTSKSISQEIKPGDTDHFLLRIATDKSSAFKIKLRINDARGDVRWSGSADMQLFVPRSGSALALRGLKN